jgi:sugar-specific transcriptional regulator TrmB
MELMQTRSSQSARNGDEEDRTMELTRFGLTKLQAEVYVTLLRLDRSAAKDIARVCSIHRVEGYRILGELRRVGLIEQAFGSPAVFSAMPPEEALAVLFNRLRDRVNALDASRDGLVDWLSSLRKVPPEDRVEEGCFRMLQGHRQEDEMLIEMWKSARSEILVMTPDGGLQKMAASRRIAALGKSFRKGVKISVLTYLNRDNRKQTEALSRLAIFATIRHANAMLFDMTIVDARQLLLGQLVEKDGMRPDCRLVSHLWINSEDYGRTSRGLFEVLWNNSVDCKMRLRQIETGNIHEGSR